MTGALPDAVGKLSAAHNYVQAEHAALSNAVERLDEVMAILGGTVAVKLTEAAGAIVGAQQNSENAVGALVGALGEGHPLVGGEARTNERLRDELAGQAAAVADAVRGIHDELSAAVLAVQTWANSGAEDAALRMEMIEALIARLQNIQQGGEQ